MTEGGLGLRGLSRNISATLLRQVVAAVVGLSSTAIIARYCGPEGNGVLAIALLLPSTLTTFLNLGVSPANVYYLGSAQVSVPQLLRVNIRISILLGAIGTVVGATGITWKSAELFPGVPTTALWLALATFPITLLNSYFLSIFQGLQQFNRYNLLAVGQSVAYLIIAVALLIDGQREIVQFVGAQLLSQLLVLVVSGHWLLPLAGSSNNSTQQWQLLRRTVQYGWRAHLSNVLAFINYKADIFITNLFVGPSGVGVYVIAVAIAEKLWLLSQAVGTVLLPRLAQLAGEEHKRKKLTPLVVRWVLLISLAGAVLIAIAADKMIALLFGGGYRAALLPLWVLMPGVVLMSASRMLANDIASRGRPELNMYAAIVVVLANVVGNLLLIPTSGIVGAAAATTIAYSGDLLLRLSIYKRLTGNAWVESLIPKLSDLQLLKAFSARA